MIPEALRAEAGKALEAWGCPLSLEQWDLADRYLSEILGYGKANLTAAKDMEELVLRHFLDGLAALGPLRARLNPSPRLVEVGAGAGFVGMALKIAWPEASVCLVDSSYKRVCFLNLAASKLRLAGLSVVHATVGQGTKNKDKGTAVCGIGGRAADAGYDAVLARALAPLPEAVGLCLPLTRQGGLAMVYQTGSPDPDEPNLLKALEGGEGRVDAVIPYVLPREEVKRHLAFFRRIPIVERRSQRENG